MASIFLRKLLKTVYFDCEMTLFGQNLLKAVCFGQNSLTYRDPVIVIFSFLGQNGLKLELRTFAVHKILMEH